MHPPQASRQNIRPPPRRVDGSVHQQLCGNLNTLHPSNYKTSASSTAAGSKGHATPLIAQATTEYQPWLYLRLTVAWVQGFFGQQVSSNSGDGSVDEAVVDAHETQPQGLASVDDIHSAPNGDLGGTAHGTRIWEAIGSYSAEPVGEGAVSIQTFEGLDESLLEHIRATPTSMTLPSDLVVAPGETAVGRVIGNAKSGPVLPGGISKQFFGSSKYTSSSEYQGYSVYPPQRSSTSTSSFAASAGKGQKLGGAPGGIVPRIRGES